MKIYSMSRITDSKQLLVCTYREDKCKGNKIFDIFNNHRYVIYKKDGSMENKKILVYGVVSCNIHILLSFLKLLHNPTYS